MSGLKLENVSYRYAKADRNALRNLNCSFDEGRLYAVVGPSGSGKSTLLSIMAGLDAPTEGAVLIDGENLGGLDLDRYRRERVSMIFQAFNLFPLLTVLENVCYPMELNGASKADAEIRAKAILESVGIDAGKHKRFPSNLSGGEQQRVAIARALSSGARVLLADEPTGNLDVENGEVVMDILRRLAHDEGYCIVVVTHDHDIAETCDVVYRMSDGVIKANEVA
ncbi:MAG: putative ABC transporter ATP-binding protein [Firmicutes bacterium ADurb.Bin182]|nr:MAG: putative ABC transporter ATP-binding protein [Firmicutes bacterium ADurb.Bin182]